MEDERSGLVREFCAVVLDAKPAIFFGENTPEEVVGNGSLAHLEPQLGELYEIHWTTLAHSSLARL